MEKARILVVDDRPNIIEVLSDFLAEEGYAVSGCSSGKDALEWLGKNEVDIVVSDVKMPRLSGLQLLEAIRKMQLSVPVILITAYGSISSAVKAIKAGAFDYLTKPLDYDRLKLLIQRALDQNRLSRENIFLREQLAEKYSLDNTIIGKSHAMQKIFNLVKTVAASHSNVLIQGESGTGKELIAKAVYYNSTRKDKPLVVVDCSTLPEGLLESELFGHEQGAFSGALETKKGRIETADGGTLYMDEIGEMPLALQAKLLRVLQERKILRVGGMEPFEVDFRLIASTNRPLASDVETGRFRADLYYRLNVVLITLPPLLDRKEDIPLLVDRFLHKFSDREGVPVKKVSPELMDRLLAHNWPGNVRELENCVERLVVVSPSDILTLKNLPEEVRCAKDVIYSSTEDKVTFDLFAIEKKTVRRALEKTDWNKSLAASLLNIDRKALYNRIKKYNLYPPSNGKG